MSDLTLGPVIGKLGGGAEISEIPVNFNPPYNTGTYHVTDVPVPEGVTARVIVVGRTEVTGTSSSAFPYLRIGGKDVGRFVRSVGYSTTVTGPTVVEARQVSTFSGYSPSFVGTVYWWEVDE